MAPAVNHKLKGTKVEIYGLTGAVHLNGQRGTLNGVLQGDRLGVDLPCGTKALRTGNIRILEDDAAALPSAQSLPPMQFSSGVDAILARPDIGSLDACHLFAEALYTACVPGAEDSFEPLPINMQDLLNLEGQVKSGVHMQHLVLDTVGHHLVLEYSCGSGWHVFQSFIKPKSLASRQGAGYTGIDWISEPQVGSASPTPHSMWGRGQIVNRGDIVKLLALIHMLRSLVDELLHEELLQQLPFEKPSGCLKDNFKPWVDYMTNVSDWAREKLESVSTGISAGEQADHVAIWLGLKDDFAEEKVLLRISIKRFNVIDDLYTRITGEGLEPPVWLDMLYYAFHKHAKTENGAIGWAYRTGCVRD